MVYFYQVNNYLVYFPLRIVNFYWRSEAERDHHLNTIRLHSARSGYGFQASRNGMMF